MNLPQSLGNQFLEQPVESVHAIGITHKYLGSFLVKALLTYAMFGYNHPDMEALKLCAT